MARAKLLEESKKKRFSVTVHPALIEALEVDNKSKYIEWLIYQDLLKAGKVDKDVLL
jgi:type II secretory pathway component PulK|tara:strand:- start:705 stop:875 length:171 start_codon:yes stop_codon:yes gene_type:complete